MKRYSNWKEYSKLCEGVEGIYGYIYLYENLWNGKQYVGQTVDLTSRLDNHLGNYQNQCVDIAIEKWTKENFDYMIIDIAFSKEELNEREIYWIEYYNTYKGKGYNLTAGGDLKPSGKDHKISKPFTVTNLNTGEVVKFGSTYECQRTSEEKLGIKLTQKTVNDILNGVRPCGNTSMENYGELQVTNINHTFETVLNDEFVEFKFQYVSKEHQKEADDRIKQLLKNGSKETFNISFKVTNLVTGEEFKFLTKTDFEKRSEKLIGVKINKALIMRILNGWYENKLAFPNHVHIVKNTKIKVEYLDKRKQKEVDEYIREHSDELEIPNTKHFVVK